MELADEYVYYSRGTNQHAMLAFLGFRWWQHMNVSSLHLHLHYIVVQIIE